MKYFYDTEFLENGSTIDLISIGIVAEDGREYYAVNADANWFRINTHDWLKTNVVPQLPDCSEWKPKAQIRDEVMTFLLRDSAPELWAWFSAYDHVVLAQLFGTMLDLPKGIPMYTHDLRAYIDYQDNDELPKQAQGLHNALADARWVREAYEHVAAALVERSERIIGPDCRDLNHRKCRGDAWDEAHDHIAECQCTCHPPLSNTSGFKGIDTTGLLPAHTCQRPGPGYPLGVIWQCLDCKTTYRMESVRDRGVSQNEWAPFEVAQ